MVNNISKRKGVTHKNHRNVFYTNGNDTKITNIEEILSITLNQRLRCYNSPSQKSFTNLVLSR